MSESISGTPVTGLVIYCDGSSDPNPGYGGSGVHGYRYLVSKPKRPTVDGQHVATSLGYLSRDERDQIKPSTEFDIRQASVTHFEVDPIEFIDGYRALRHPTTNNQSELTGMEVALQLILTHRPAVTVIKADSQYAIKGTTEYLDKWARSQYINFKGEPVKNSDYWKRIHALVTKIREEGLVYHIVWVEGHSGKLGNELADQAATVAKYASRLWDVTPNAEALVTTPAAGYWSDEQPHPFVSQPYCYYIDNSDVEAVPGKHLYYTGAARGGNELMGNKSINGSFAVVLLNNPIERIEMVRRASRAIAKGHVIASDVTRLYSGSVTRQLKVFGPTAIGLQKEWESNFQCAERETVSSAILPPLMAFRGMESLGGLYHRLCEYISGSSNLTTTDITDRIYTPVVVPGKKGQPPTSVHALKPEWVPGSVDVKVEVDYGGGKHGVGLQFDIDLPSRNHLKRMEKLVKHVKVLAWGLDTHFNYGVVVETLEGDIGIWAGVYTNLKVIK